LQSKAFYPSIVLLNSNTSYSSWV